MHAYPLNISCVISFKLSFVCLEPLQLANFLVLVLPVLSMLLSLRFIVYVCKFVEPVPSYLLKATYKQPFLRTLQQNDSVFSRCASQELALWLATLPDVPVNCGNMVRAVEWFLVLQSFCFCIATLCLAFDAIWISRDHHFNTRSCACGLMSQRYS
jgi:hypothetical protein